jgi:hypothetical protein
MITRSTDIKSALRSRQRGFLLNPYRLGAGGGGVDPYYSNVSLLLHADGTNGSTTFTDNSQSPKTVTAYGNARISTAQSKFGGSSMYFDGAGDYLTSPTSPAFEFGSGDFTVELFTYMNTLPNAYARIIGYNVGPADTGNESFVLEVSNTNKMSMCFTSNAPLDYYVIEPNLITLNVWIHWAMVRTGSVVTLYRDGTSVATLNVGTSAMSQPTTHTLSIGRWLSTTGNERYFNGYLDDLRITKGVCRYTSSFTPPTAAFPNS